MPGCPPEPAPPENVGGGCIVPGDAEVFVSEANQLAEVLHRAEGVSRNLRSGAEERRAAGVKLSPVPPPGLFSEAGFSDPDEKELAGIQQRDVVGLGHQLRAVAHHPL